MEYIANTIADLHEQDEPQLSYKLLRDYSGETSLSNQELAAIFETVVRAGDYGAAMALLQIGTDWIDAASGEFTESE